MSSEIELVADGDGVAVIGDPATVDLFLASHDLPSRDLELGRLRSVLGTGSAATKAAGEVAANSGRWVKLTEKSAEALKHGELMKGSGEGVGRAIVMKNGKTSHIIEIVRTPGTMLTNPAVLSGAAGLMAQLAMQQAMDEITDYLATIDKKVDDVLRGQKDAVLSAMVGAGLVIDEALTVRDQVGRVSEITWSKVQATALTIATTQAHAISRIERLAEDLERDRKLDDVASTIRSIQGSVREWLGVLARCFQLQDAVGVLEIDRVIDGRPTLEVLDSHRLALHTARQNRTDVITQATERLMDRLDAAADRALANGAVLRRPRTARAIVSSSNEVTSSVLDLYDRLSVAHARELSEARRWREAASDVRGQAVERGAVGVASAKRLGKGGVTRVRTTGENLVGRAANLRSGDD